MQHHRVLLGHLIQHMQRPAAGIHVVFGENFEPVDGRMVFQDVLEVHGAQPDAESQVRIIPSDFGISDLLSRDAVQLEATGDQVIDTDQARSIENQPDQKQQKVNEVTSVGSAGNF